MALPYSGPLSLSQIQGEFGGSNPISMSEYYRGGGLVTNNNTNVPTSGAISISNFYGATRQFSFTITSNQINSSLRGLAINAGWDQSAPLIATINIGVYMSSTSTGVPALTVSGSFPNGVQLTNNGFIVGMGGTGGAGSARNSNDTDVAGSTGSGGGLALLVTTAVSIINNGTVAGGGGGGGGGQGGYSIIGYSGKDSVKGFVGGGGGGGGRSSAAMNSGAGAGRAAGSGSTYTGNGSNGSAGTFSGGGGGGAGGQTIYTIGYPLIAGSGGSGGNWGSSGFAGGMMSYSLGPPTYGPGPYSGGGGGGAVSGNSNISWIATGTRLGSIG